MSNKYPAIPECRPDNSQSMHATIMALKEAVESMSGQRRGILPPVTWDDLVRLGLCSQEDVPRGLL